MPSKQFSAPSKQLFDSFAYTTLWWFATIFLNLALIAYGVSKIQDVISKDMFLQIKTIEVSPARRFVNFPDIIFCTGESVIEIWAQDKHGSPVDTFENASFVPYDVSSQIELDSIPCDYGHDTLWVWSMENTPVDVAHAGMLGFNFWPKNEAQPGNFSSQIAFGFLLPSQNNPFRGGLPSSPNSFPTSMRHNVYDISSYSAKSIQVIPEATKTIRSDIWGLFGAYEKESSHSISSNADSQHPMSPLKQISYSRITSIPNAFAAWGGAFTAAWSLFYICFGTPRVDPFGFIARIFRRRSQASLAKAYGFWSSNVQPNKPQESMSAHSILTCASTSLHLPTSERTCHQIADMPFAATSVTSPDIAAEECAVEMEIIAEKSSQNDICDENHSERIQKLEVDLNKLVRLLKDHYLEMDLTNAEEIPRLDDKRWYKRFWPF
ncbi:hypothetical protein BGZ67_009720 [Mortierella alpina]|nr:hypothetical protein BGZ67_009720 [Mortierella alpina]